MKWVRTSDRNEHFFEFLAISVFLLSVKFGKTTERAVAYTIPDGGTLLKNNVQADCYQSFRWV